MYVTLKIVECFVQIYHHIITKKYCLQITEAVSGLQCTISCFHDYIVLKTDSINMYSAIIAVSKTTIIRSCFQEKSVLIAVSIT